ncbi:Fc receptor-like protein 5, partial [Clupea harengus]|uniref:Fc receptor-like protein 5 n=1 Tax=Clupea harengus TaxID=7950 RepID=A0A8M1KQJ0_CLUHA
MPTPLEKVIPLAEERPKAVLSLSPSWTPVFSGETVTLTCSIQGESTSDWIYSWFKGQQQVYPRHQDWSNSNEYRLQSVQEDSSVVYGCRGRRADDVFSERPKAAVTLTPASRNIFRGESVTLRCEIPEWTDTDWDYSWYLKRISNSHVASSQDQEYRISSAADGDSGEYTCRGRQRATTQSSQTSDGIRLTVSERPKAVLSLSPSWTPVFSGETVTLTCSIQGESTSDWIYRWFKGQQQVYPHQGWRYSNGLRLQSLQEDQSGDYSCRGRRTEDAKDSHQSDDVTLTVSTRPTATLTVEPRSPVFTGETVTLKCVIESLSGWVYIWYKDRDNKVVFEGDTFTLKEVTESHNSKYWCKGERKERPTSSQISGETTVKVQASKPKLTLNPGHQLLTGDSDSDIDTQTSDPVVQTDGNSYSIISVQVSDGGQYWCRAGRGDPVYHTQYSDEVEIKVTERPEATVSFKSSWTEFFSGEKVSLRCDIKSGESSDWEYSWFRDGVYKPEKEHEINPSQSGNYTCKGQRKRDKTESEESVAVGITVSSEKAQAVLGSLSQMWLTEGDSVTLSCEVRGSTTGWRFHWYKTAPYSPGYSLQLVSDSISGAGGSYTLSPAALRHTGVYVCRAERGEPAYHTEFSQPQPLWVTGVSPPASVIIHSNWTQIFTYESLSLSCGVQGNSTGLRWFTGRGGESKCPTDWRSETGSTCTIRSAASSDSGVYWCQSESGEQSNPVNITVHTGDVILESPAHPVTEGDPLTLRCRYRYKPSNISADFYRDGTLLQTSTTGEMTIPAVSESHEGVYMCRNPEKGESPESCVT